MNPDPLRICYLQTVLHWEDYPANEVHFAHLLDRLEDQVDLILFPEMFGTGYLMKPERIAQPMDGPAVRWMTQVAHERQAVLIGSLAVEDETGYHNRMICAEPDGMISHYDKRHLFTFAGEHEQYTAGSHQLLITVKGWRIMPLICYDLRFPVWSRNVSGYDVLLYVANWPTPRVHAWTTLLKARAIENQSYVVGVNRIGEDENGNTYPGRSAVYDMAGLPMHESDDREDMPTITLDFPSLKAYREKFAFLPDSDRFQIL